MIVFNMPLSKRLLFLLFAVIIGFFLTSVIGAFATQIFGAESTKAMRIVVVLQDILVFIAPAILAAVMSTRQPDRLMCLTGRIKPLPMVLAIATLVASIPAMNAVIWLNEQCPLPASLEQSLRAMENNAQAMIEALQGPHTVPNLLMSVLIVGIFAGLSEELLFRGALQRMLATGGLNPHAAIWIAAAIFSLVHLQFYGFVPRMLLGAFFGYTLWWTGSIWVPVILHSINNTVYLVSEWMSAGTESLGTGNDVADFAAIAFSVAATALGLWATRKFSSTINSQKNLEN